eukprot:2066439-Rhodomonas_salina.2
MTLSAPACARAMSDGYGGGDPCPPSLRRWPCRSLSSSLPLSLIAQMRTHTHTHAHTTLLLRADWQARWTSRWSNAARTSSARVVKPWVVKRLNTQPVPAERVVKRPAQAGQKGTRADGGRGWEGSRDLKSKVT